jgi:hypothetical protein
VFIFIFKCPFGVFELIMQRKRKRSGQKGAIEKKSMGRSNRQQGKIIAPTSTLFVKRFDIYFPKKIVVFLNSPPLLRKAPTYLCQIYAAFNLFFLQRPLSTMPSVL